MKNQELNFNQVSECEALFFELLRAEHEDEVLIALDRYGYSLENADAWRPLGDNNGNFSTVGNQQEEGTAALVEKIVNSVDAVLLGECHTKGIDPEGSSAPPTMQEAVENFMGVKEGRLDFLDGREQGNLAGKHINLVATGSKRDPCYLVIDNGEGQSPNQFENTFVSATRTSPKIRIPFVQGKFNAGSTGSLQFCGKHNIQLVVSKRSPHAPAVPGDDSNDEWGFTVIRRKRPTLPNDRSSVFQYLVIDGEVPRFSAESLALLPGKSSKNRPASAYSEPLHYGTCVKLYNYKWPGKSLVTTDAKRELERCFQLPCLPFRLHETRDYTANYYSTTVSGVWNTLGETGAGKVKHEAGFPANLNLNLSREGIGEIPVRILVWKEDVRPKDVATGVYFLVNGQVHAEYEKAFVSRSLGFDYISDYVLVAVDLTNIDRGVFEDLIMGSRTRFRKNDDYDVIREKLRGELRGHTGLKQINAEWRRRRKEKAIEADKDGTKIFDLLLKSDPGLANALNLGGVVPGGVGPSKLESFEGKRFPSYFRLAKEPKTGLVKRCPINATVKVDFETDVENDFFTRPDDRGQLSTSPSMDLIESTKLWNGEFTAKFRVPWSAKPGDSYSIEVSVADPSESGSPPGYAGEAPNV